MIYVYRNAAGEEIELDKPMSEAPPVGHVLLKDGVRFIRQPGNICPIVKQDVHFQSESLPRNWKYAPRVDAQGKPLFDGMREVREAVAKANQHGEGATWDP